jgi:hypothetical protein
MVQSSIEDAPYFGIQNRTAADRYSIPSDAALLMRHKLTKQCAAFFVARHGALPR